ncbi:hypothetical protein DXG01_014680 [Tephrocybe rancida]|nr:hypothetical protein DXG01_014680 [Tephrocybe rancida]
MLWQASTKQVQEAEDLNQGMDPSWVSLPAAKSLFKPAARNANIGSGYDSSLLGPAGDGWYSPFPESPTASPTPALPFQGVGPDITNIPPLEPAAYQIHFQIPPLGPGAFAAPDESEMDPLVVATFWFIPDYDRMPEQEKQQTGHSIGAPVPVPYSGNDDDPAYGMELSDSESLPSAVAQPAPDSMPVDHLSSDLEVSDRGDDMDPAFGMELSDDEWDPCVGLVLSDDEDVAANMEISDDET